MGKHKNIKIVQKLCLEGDFSVESGDTKRWSRHGLRGCTLGGIFNFYKDRKSLILGVWAAPGGRPDPKNRPFPGPGRRGFYWFSRHDRSSWALSLVAVKPLGKMIILVLVFCCFGSVFGQSWPQDPFKRVRLEKWCRTHLKLAP